MNLIDKLKEVAADANAKGIPLPLIRDKGQGSHTLTMFVLTWIIAIVLLAGKAANLVGTVDYQNVIWLYGFAGSLYLGRNYQKGPGGSMSITDKKDGDRDDRK